MYSRRAALSRSLQLAALMVAAGILPRLARADSGPYDKAAFEAKSIPDLLKALGAAAPVESKDVTLTAPDIAENGAVVPIGAATTLPDVKRMLVLVEKNPAVLSAIFEISEAVEPVVATRVKMGQTSNVFAVAMLADGRMLFAQKEVKVTLGGCGG